jgi:hypothetical protein
VEGTVTVPGPTARSPRTCPQALTWRSHGTTTRRVPREDFLASHPTRTVDHGVVSAPEQPKMKLQKTSFSLTESTLPVSLSHRPAKLAIYFQQVRSLWTSTRATVCGRTDSMRKRPARPRLLSSARSVRRSGQRGTSPGKSTRPTRASA